MILCLLYTLQYRSVRCLFCQIRCMRIKRHRDPARHTRLLYSLSRSQRSSDPIERAVGVETIIPRHGIPLCALQSLRVSSSAVMPTCTMAISPGVVSDSVGDTAEILPDSLVSKREYATTTRVIPEDEYACHRNDIRAQVVSQTEKLVAFSRHDHRDA